MPLYATCKPCSPRQFATGLALLSGLGHIGQLWLLALDGDLLLDALLGMLYLLVALGLAGQSRFTLWVAVALPLAAAVREVVLLLHDGAQLWRLWHCFADVALALLCVWILVRSRSAGHRSGSL